MSILKKWDKSCSVWFSAIVIIVHLLEPAECNVGLERRFCGRGTEPICCPGWHNGIDAPCSIASCAGNCGDRGRCIRPNTCLCEDHRSRFECETRGDEKMQADQTINSCPENCRNRGACVSNKCQCDSGFTGERCEITIESACFAKLQRGLCVNPVQQLTGSGNVTTLMTRETCCNAFGVAWGEPCQPCQVGYCGRGFREVYGTCRDINECHIAGVCRGGQCINMEGTYSCKCPSGYEFNEESLGCTTAENPCNRYGHRCSPGGKCVPENYGNYKCLCSREYVAAEDQKSCVPRKKMTFNVCSLYKDSICQNGICISRDNSYECVCNEGFEASADRKSCRYKIDVCAVHRGYLCQNGECVSYGRDFYCKCNPGFTLSFDRRRCVNQCEQLGSAACQNGQCIAEPNGDYHCQCFPPFQVTRGGKHCLPIDRLTIPDTFENEQTKYNYLPSFLFRRPNRRKPNQLFDADYQQDYEDVKDLSKGSHSTQVLPWGQFRPTEKPPCELAEIRENCAGGFCLNLGGSAYQCECRPGYVSVQENRLCVKAAESTKLLR